MNACKVMRSGALSVALVLAGTSFAQARDIDRGENCYCIVPADSTGQVLTSSGDVQVSLAKGFLQAVSGTALTQGSLIIVGASSDAHIVFGGCHLSILPLRDVSLDPVNGGICVRTTPIDGRTAGFDPTATSTLSTLSANFPADAVVSATGKTATVGSASNMSSDTGVAVADEDAEDIPILAIVAGLAAVGAFVAIAASNQGGATITPNPVDPVQPVSP